MDHLSFSIGITQIITSNSKQIYIFEDPKSVENKSKSLHNWFALCCYNYVSSTIYVSCIMLKFVVYIKYQVDRLITIVTRMYQVQLCIFCIMLVSSRQTYNCSYTYVSSTTLHFCIMLGYKVSVKYHFD